MSTKYPQGIITPTPPYKSTTAKSFSGVWTLEQLANNFYYYRQAISKSLRFRSSASAYLSRTFSSPTSQYVWTFSAWVKRGVLGSSSYQALMATRDTGSAGIWWWGDTLTIANNGAGALVAQSTAVFRDPSAWYHVVVTSNGTTIVGYVNNQQVLSYTGTIGRFNTAVVHNIANDTQSSYYFDGYMAEVNFIDGQALDPSYFGQISPITGVWSPAPYVGSYGTNGFYLKFSDTTSTTTLCYDYSGNSNNWTPNNISLTAGSTYDSMLDSPTNYDNGGNGVGNYAVLNPLNLVSPSTLSAGNLNFDTGIAGGGGVNANWQFPLTGKFYFEFSNLSGVSTANGRALCANALWESNTGVLYVNGSSVATIGGYTDGDTLAFATDCAAQTIAVYKNNTLLYTASAGANLYLWPVAGFRDGSGSNGITGSINFGQRPFAYTPPTGYKALNTQNLPAPSIQNGSNFMAATLYTGTNATQSISNSNNSVSFQPDFVWIKNRANSGADHALVDSVRGAAYWLASNLTQAESNNTAMVTSINSNGFTVGASNMTNQSGVGLVGWQWKAGGTAVTNTAGSITSQVSANTTSGFAVVTYTGTGSNATVGHGLGVAPSMIINKSRNAAQNWTVFHAGLANMTTAYVRLNTTDAAGTLGNAVATPTSTTFGISASTADTSTYVAYCFAAITGYSAFGSYTGNGSADGPFVYCGFRPRWLLVKRTDVANSWVLMDSSRSSFNYADKILWPNLSDAEANGGTTTSIDFVSNGFKQRGVGASINASGGTYIYAAFAENPFNYSLAR